MTRPWLLRGSWCVALALASVAKPGWALDAAEAQRRALTTISQVETEVLRGGSAPRELFAPPSPAERIAAGDMLLRTKDLDRAVNELSKVLELYRQGKVPEAAYADASFLIGEAYFQSRQYLAARRHYREVLDQAQRPTFESYVGRAVSRLVDVALRTGDLESLDYVFARLNRLPATDRSGSLAYARAKALFAHKELAAAKQAISVVPAGSDYAMQSQYLLGVIYVREAAPPPSVNPPSPAPGAAPVAPPTAAAAPSTPPQRYVAAVEQFRSVTRMPARNAAQKHVVDLAWMAIGRLFHEMDAYLDAAEAYSHVDRASPEFSSMLYELAWVYVRLGDYMRAQRALEVLAIMDPENIEAADGSLLRADLMLRSGQFEKALALYKSVQGKFDPIRDQVDRFLQSTNDPAVYYDRLTADPSIPSSDDRLPGVVVEWAREQAEDEHVFGMIEDVNRSRDLIRSSRKLASKLNAVLGGPTRIRAMPELRAKMQRSLSLLNRASRSRVTLSEGLDDVSPQSSGELTSVRQQRRALMRRMGYLPQTDVEFSKREESGERQWDKVSQQLQGLMLEADRLNAVVNGLRRVLREADQHGVTSDPASRERFQVEIEQNERDLVTYRRRIEEYKNAMDLGRAQIGFGDQRYSEDEDVRRRFRELLAREVALCASGQGGEDATAYARSIQPLLLRADVLESRLEGEVRSYDEQAGAQAATLLKKVESEVGLLETSSQNLDTLDQQARLLVGEVAMRNFALVRDRLKNVVLRADVGIVQEAWEVREEQRVRVRNLQRERSREESSLNDELREVIDDAAEDQ
ncbi:MAG TPA: tetratricopeptide repeat protein [Polyangiaceae bacterium]|nr:tetratricopeptide repeat protein [Polyangiaceae bacterium]